jgi:hypothetical protein
MTRFTSVRQLLPFGIKSEQMFEYCRQNQFIIENVFVYESSESQYSLQTIQNK